MHYKINVEIKKNTPYGLNSCSGDMSPLDKPLIGTQMSQKLSFRSVTNSHSKQVVRSNDTPWKSSNIDVLLLLLVLLPLGMLSFSSDCTVFTVPFTTNICLSSKKHYNS